MKTNESGMKFPTKGYRRRFYMAETKDKEYVLRQVEEQGIKFIRLWFTDILGALKSFAIVKDELEDALDEGMGFDGSSITGYQTIEESDMIAKPDPSTYEILPWRPKEKGVARIICDVLDPSGKPYEGDPRYVLKRNLLRAEKKGLIFNIGPELEYFYFMNSQGADVIDHGGYFDLTPLDQATDLRRDTIFALEDMGIRVEYSHHEVGPSQHEILPWRPKEKGVARIICDVLDPSGKPYEGDPRYVLKRNLLRAEKKGLIFNIGPKLEYFYFMNSQGADVIDHGGYFDLT